MAKKLYEFSGLLNYHFIIAADNEKDACNEIAGYEKHWLEGDFIAVSDVQLVDTRKPKSKDLTDEAHEII
ncbi:MAG: hypothetical protein WDA13_03940 [Candidatus Shapirobacteria bacterium]|jgi:hypothetical protein